MAIVVNKPIPEFEAPATGGIKVTNHTHQGRIVVLYFYPKDNTPGCTTEACDFRDASAALKKKGAVVLGVSMDSEASHQKFIAKHQLNFTLLADTDGNMIVFTQTLSTWGGNYYVSKGLGFLYNDHFRGGRGGTGYGSMLPLMRSSSTSVPTMLFAPQQTDPGAYGIPGFAPKMAVGCAGNAWIPLSVYNIITGVIDGKLGAQAAIGRQRRHLGLGESTADEEAVGVRQRRVMQRVHVRRRRHFSAIAIRLRPAHVVHVEDQDVRLLPARPQLLRRDIDVGGMDERWLEMLRLAHGLRGDRIEARHESSRSCGRHSGGS